MAKDGYSKGSDAPAGNPSMGGMLKYLKAKSSKDEGVSSSPGAEMEYEPPVPTGGAAVEGEGDDAPGGEDDPNYYPNYECEHCGKTGRGKVKKQVALKKQASNFDTEE